METLDGVMLPFERDRALAAPVRADDLDRLLQRFERLTRCSRRAAERADRLPEAARAETEIEPTAGQHVEGRSLLRDHRRPAQRQVRDVGKEAHAFRPREQVADQRPRLEVPPLVRVVLDPDQIDAELVGAVRERTVELDVRARRNDAQAELERSAVA